MIYEYALEPELVASWVDRAAYRFFDGKFGLGCRRIASAFPSNEAWRRRVVEVLEATFVGRSEPEKQAARKRLDALLSHFRPISERRGALATTWRQDILAEHREYPFAALLGHATPRPTAPIVIAEDLDEQHPAWILPTPPTPRRAAEFAKALRPMLRFARDIRFVDPYFDPEKDNFSEPLAAMIEAAQQRRDPRGVRFQVHTAINEARRKGLPKEASCRSEDIAREICNTCSARFTANLRPGVELAVCVWEESAGDKLHNRYVLSDIGSVGLPAGLEQARKRQLAHTDDIFVLSREQHARRWTQYRIDSTEFKRARAPLIIVGK
ncbi:hypothetical protein [Polyangium sp. 15x6]|uniref:hypothetical protein n=1 Tax=Polyangium sp. 15x6 TaxID=3042687 RepID=UPI00249A7890|nr:hypothetical protein [Polyangium sp. 15x6]MDI3289762.1 hypothetical protein [Polyangium sp. 15x6]